MSGMETRPVEERMRLALVMEAGVVRLVKAPRGDGRKTRGQKLVEGLRGRGDFKMSTDEIVALMRGPAFRG